MDNHVFNVKFNRENGGISHLLLQNDQERMNFCKGGKTLFTLRNFKIESFQETEKGAQAVSSFQGVKATADYGFENGCLTVKITIRNENAYPVYFRSGDIVLDIPFNDAYESSDVCMKERCHTHIWTGFENSYIRLERMGDSENNLGVWFQKGSFVSYNQEECKHSNRGVFSLNFEGFHLKASETYDVAFVVFTHKGGADFFEKAKQLKGFFHVQSGNG